MKTKIAKIGKFYYLIIPGDLPEQYRFSDRVGLNPVEDGIVLKAHKKARFGWPEQLTAAIEAVIYPMMKCWKGC
jgi:hypothetical protein